MDPTLGIAIWGAVTGTVATVGGILALVRDRPKLVATQSVVVTPALGEADRKAQVVLLVVNEGRQPVTIRSAGFGLDFTVKVGRWPFRQHAPFALLGGTREQARLPLRLEAGAPLELRLDVIDIVVDTKMLPRGFAEDSRGRITAASPPFTAERLLSAQRVGSRTIGRQPADLGGEK